MPRSDLPVKVLIQQLHSSDWTGRCDAARLLGQSRDPRAVDALLPDLDDPDWRVRRNAAQALGVLRDPRAVEPLVTALKDRVMTVRQRAIVALGRIKDLQALPALLDIALAGKRESYDAVQAIRKFGKKALPELAKRFEQTGNQELMLLLIEMKHPGAFDLVLRLLQSQDPAERLTAIRELGKLGDRRAIPYLIAQLHHSDLMIQSEAVQALGKLKAVETVPTLLGLLADDELYGPRSSVYRAVTEAFQTFGGIADEIRNAFPGNYPPFFNVAGSAISLPEAMGFLGNDPSHMLAEALAGLQNGAPEQVETPGIPTELLKNVFEDMAWKFGIMFADARDASQDRVKRLLELLNSEFPLVRSAAALNLPWYGDERALESLGRLKKDPDETVNAAAMWAYNALQRIIELRKQLGR